MKASTSTALTHETAANALLAGVTLCPQELHLAPFGCRIRVRSNSAAVIEHLSRYFAQVATPPAPSAIDVIAVERPALDPAAELGVDLSGWSPEARTSEQAVNYTELPGARLIHRTGTGTVFLQGASPRVVAGPCRPHDKQIVDFINAQYVNWLQHRGWHSCRAAAVVQSGRALGIAAIRHDDASDLMLRLMEHPQLKYLTYDHLFVRRNGTVVEATGLPRLPRVKLGTIVHNRQLSPLIPQAQREALLALPHDELWHLEEEYDVLIEQVYGTDRISLSAQIGALLILNWEPQASTPWRLAPVNLADRRDLLGALTSSLGPFHQRHDGSFLSGNAPLDEAMEIQHWQDTPVYEVSGGVAFDELVPIVLDRLLRQA